jgi:hypothetical protein
VGLLCELVDGRGAQATIGCFGSQRTFAQAEAIAVVGGRSCIERNRDAGSVREQA